MTEYGGKGAAPGPEVHTPRLRAHRVASDAPFAAGVGVALALSAGLVLLLLTAVVVTTTPAALWGALVSPATRHALLLTLATSSLATLMALALGVPAAYALSRGLTRWSAGLETLLSLPLVLPPVVIGAALLVAFSSPALRGLNEVIPLRYAPAGIVLAQLPVALALVVGALRGVFEGISPRQEDVARSLGASRMQAFLRVVLPEARAGIVAAAVLAWARTLGEFGPILIFVGITPMRTEVLTTAVYRRVTHADFPGAMALSLLMVAVAVAALLGARAMVAPTDRRGRRPASGDAER